MNNDRPAAMEALLREGYQAAPLAPPIVPDPARLHDRLDRSRRMERRVLAAVTAVIVLVAVAVPVLAAYAQRREALPARGGPLDVAVVVTTADTGAVGSYAASVRAELERFAQAHDSEVNWYATTRPQEIDRAAARFRTVFLVGGRYAPVALAAAKRHPATHFFLLDAPDRTGRASPPNLTAMRIERGHLTYEAGRAAAAVSRTSHVGVVFPRRTATTTALAAAFRTGAQDKAPGITVRIDYSTTGQAGVPELARRQLTGGADVVFGDRAALAVVATSAGAPGQTWFIGMDDDYGAIAPKPQRSYVLTSVVPRLDLGVKQACRALVAGTPSKIGRYAPFTSDVVLSTAGGHLASVPGALTSPRDRSGELRPAYGSPFPEEH